MSDTKFTPGAWEFDPRSENLVGSDGNRVCVYASGLSFCGLPDETSRANARLIAAAPELYASLKEMLEWCIWDTEYAARARKALAKAEGK